MAGRELKLRLQTNVGEQLVKMLVVWIQSRPNEFPEFMEWMRQSHNTDLVTPELIVAAGELGISRLGSTELMKIINGIVDASVPVSRFVEVSLNYTGMPVAHREQFVREQGWTHWVASFRVLPMQDFADLDEYYVPPSLKDEPSRDSISPIRRDAIVKIASEVASAGRDGDAEKMYVSAMFLIQEMYRGFLDMGMVMQEARGILPPHATHAGSATADLRDLMHTISKRSCWVAQADYWTPFTRQVVEQLTEQTDMLGHIASPPCFRRGSNKFLGCKFATFNEERIALREKVVVCPIYLTHASVPNLVEVIENGGFGSEVPMVWNEHLDAMIHAHGQGIADQARRDIEHFTTIWGRDPFTGMLNGAGQ